MRLEVARRFWFAEIRCSSSVEDKIKSKHGVTLDDVRECLLLYACKGARRDGDHEYGLREYP